ncbi:unnamed protein product [Rotaria sp. Silwood2]|nr:unnamed protein product [Rotaria sp. Silwood2]
MAISLIDVIKRSACGKERLSDDELSNRNIICKKEWFNFPELLISDPLLEDLMLYEMPDVELLRIKANGQYHLENAKPDKDLEEKAENDLAAYVSIYNI